MHTRMTMEELEAGLSAEFGGPAIGAWPRNKGERMRPHKGGGGGDGGAGQREAERQARIKAATDEINKIFNASPRETLYSDQKSAVYDLNKAEVDRQAKEAERKTRFGLARVGLMGGSEDVDAAAENDRRTNEGLLRAGGIADQAAADFRVADERTRSNLISMAQSGIDTGTAAQMALGGLKANSDSMAQARAGATVGGLFNDLSQAYLINQTLAGKANGSNYGQQWYGVSNPRTASQGTVQN